MFRIAVLISLLLAVASMTVSESRRCFKRKGRAHKSGKTPLLSKKKAPFKCFLKRYGQNDARCPVLVMHQKRLEISFFPQPVLGSECSTELVFDVSATKSPSRSDANEIKHDSSDSTDLLDVCIMVVFLCLNGCPSPDHAIGRHTQIRYERDDSSDHSNSSVSDEDEYLTTDQQMLDDRSPETVHLHYRNEFINTAAVFRRRASSAFFEFRNVLGHLGEYVSLGSMEKALEKSIIFALSMFLTPICLFPFVLWISFGIRASFYAWMFIFTMMVLSQTFMGDFDIHTYGVTIAPILQNVNRLDNDIRILSRIFKTRGAVQNDQQPDTCAVCLDPIDVGHTSVMVTRCGHSIHRKCVIYCVQRSGKTGCPLCRQEMLADEE